MSNRLLIITNKNDKLVRLKQEAFKNTSVFYAT